LKVTRLHVAEIIVDTPLQLPPAAAQSKTPLP